jgi:hypothetical protein
MVNDPHPSSLNPLSAWRCAQSPRPSLTELAALAGVTVTCWRSWEAWGAVGGKMPNASNWVIIEQVTQGAVTSNDFVNMLKEAA